MVRKLRVSDGFYTLFKKTFFVFDTALLKCFVFSRVGILDYPCCNNPCGAYLELGQGDFYSFNQKFVYYLPTKMLPQEKPYLPQSRLQHLSQSGHLQACKTSDVLFLSLFLANYPPSSTTLRFPHSSSMNISLGKSIKFPIPSVSSPSCSSSTALTLRIFLFNKNVIFFKNKT